MWQAGTQAWFKESADPKKEEYKDDFSFLKKDYAIRDVGKSSGKGISTIQRVKRSFAEYINQ